MINKYVFIPSPDSYQDCQERENKQIFAVQHEMDKIVLSDIKHRIVEFEIFNLFSFL